MMLVYPVVKKRCVFYLGAHAEYNSKLLNVFAFNNSAVAIRYTSNAKGIHPQNKQPLAYSNVMMEVLDIEDGKVALFANIMNNGSLQSSDKNT